MSARIRSQATAVRDDVLLYVLTDPRDDLVPTLRALARVLTVDPGKIGIVIRHQEPRAAREIRALVAKSGAPAPCFSKVASVGADGEAALIHVGALKLHDPIPRQSFTASAHDLEEARRAENAHALFVGPIFDVPEKASPRGASFVREVRRALPHTPLYALGGANAENAKELITEGADGVAVIRAVMQARDPAAAAHEIVEAVAIAKRAILSLRTR